VNQLDALMWAVDRIMEASDDNISESGNGNDSLVEAVSPLSTQRGGDSAGVSQA